MTEVPIDYNQENIPLSQDELDYISLIKKKCILSYLSNDILDASLYTPSGLLCIL